MESVGMRELELSSRTLALLRQESQYSVGGFRPPPAFIDRAEGVHLWVILETYRLFVAH